MVNEMKFADKIHLQKYIYIIDAFLSNKIQASIFVKYFLEIRREDKYWLTSSFDNEINKQMDSIFLDVDEYNPDELYDSNDEFNINEDELRARLSDKLSIIKKKIS